MGAMGTENISGIALWSFGIESDVMVEIAIHTGPTGPALRKDRLSNPTVSQIKCE